MVHSFSGSEPGCFDGMVRFVSGRLRGGKRVNEKIFRRVLIIEAKRTLLNVLLIEVIKYRSFATITLTDTDDYVFRNRRV